MKVLRRPIWVLSAPDGPWFHGDVMTLTYFPHYWPLRRTGRRWIPLTKWPIMQNDVLFFVDLNKLLNTWASYQIRKIACCACAGNAGNAFPRHRLQRKLLVSDPGMHHARAVMHVGIAYPRWRGKRSRHSRRMRIRKFTYLVRGP